MVTISLNRPSANANAGKGADRDPSIGTVQGTVIDAREAAAIERQVIVEGNRFSPLWRARYNLCVQEGKTRGDDLKLLRFTAPEVYCIEFTDTFVPRAGGQGWYGSVLRRRLRR